VAPNATVLASWEPFEDAESGIERYEYVLNAEVAVTEAFRLRGWQSPGPRLAAPIFAGPAVHNLSLYVRACNGAGTCSVATTLPNVRPPRLMLFTEAPTPVTVLIVTHMGSGFLVDISSITILWRFDDASAATVPLSYDVCIGTSPYGCQTMAPVATSASIGQLRDLPLRCGGTYHLTVRASNCAGFATTSASTGAKLCCEPPTAGAVSVHDAQGEAVSVVTNSSSLTIGWTPFIEDCSGIHNLTVMLLRASGAVLWTVTLTADATGVSVPAALAASLASGRYVASVAAESLARVQSVWSNASFSIETTAPNVSAVQFVGHWVVPRGMTAVRLACRRVPHNSSFDGQLLTRSRA
jgi:hypothetical protein